MDLKFIPAFNGDCILLSFFDQDQVRRNILIDGGISRTYPKYLKNEITILVDKGENIDLLIITHIDDDHIGGIIKIYEDATLNRDLIKQVWFNSGNLLSDFFNSRRDKTREVSIIPSDQTDMSIDQGITLENALLMEGKWLQELIHADLDPIDFFGATVTICPFLAWLNNTGLKASL